jgi:RimJ/RimL family protein N-acetyltransferase
MANVDDSERYAMDWFVEGAKLRVAEPTASELSAQANALAAYYNEPTNRALLTNERDFSAEDVAAHFALLRAEGGRPFLMFEDDSLIGDSDLRRVERHEAEFAILVGARDRQGRGRGTLLSVMVHALAFGRLALEKVYVSVRPENLGSLRMLAKVGYSLDATSEARRYADALDDVCLSVDAWSFQAGAAHRLPTGSIRVTVR